MLEFRSCIEEVISGLDNVVSTMKKGEVAMLTISPEHGFGDVKTHRDLVVVPPNSKHSKLASRFGNFCTAWFLVSID